MTGSDDQLDEGRTLQLPIYAAMAAEHFHYDVDKAHGAYINPLSADGVKRKLDVDAGLLSGPARQLLSRSFQDMAAGEFTFAIAADPQASEDMCRFCGMSSCSPTDRLEQGRTMLAAAQLLAQVAP